MRHSPLTVASPAHHEPTSSPSSCDARRMLGVALITDLPRAFHLHANPRNVSMRAAQRACRTRQNMRRKPAPALSTLHLAAAE